MRRLIDLLGITLVIAFLPLAATSDHSSRTTITLGFARGTAGRLVSEMGEQAGARLSIRDKALASRPTLAYVKHHSLEETLRVLSAYLSIKPGTGAWLQTENGRVFQEDRASRSGRSSRAITLRNGRARRLVEDINQALNLGLMTPERLMAERSRHPNLVASINDLKPGLALLAALNPDHRTALLSGRSIKLQIAVLPPPERELAKALIGGRRRTRRSVPQELGGGWMEWTADKDFLSTPIFFRLAGKPDRPGISVKAHILPLVRSGYRDLLHPNDPPEELKPDWLREAMKTEAEKAKKSREKKLRVLERVPALQKVVSLKAWVDVPDADRPGHSKKQAADLTGALRQVFDQAGVSIIGDYDPCWDDYYVSLGDSSDPEVARKRVLSGNTPEWPMWKALEFIADHFGVTWDMEGDFVMVRSPRVDFAMLDGIDILDPAPLPNYFQQLLKTYKPGDRLPGVTYDE